MAKWLDKFLEFKNEADATRKFALFAVVIITFGLASLSVTGIVATADWNLLSALPILGMIIAVLGAELLATVAFIRTLTASTRFRKVAGTLIFVGLAAVGVHNAENGAHVVWPERFAESSASLAAKAELAGEEAGTLGTAQQAAIQGTGAELERVRTQIANLEVEQRKMAAQSPEGVAEAQALLLAQGKYFGRVDGIRQDLTEAAMRRRGEEIGAELAVLKQREGGLLAGQASPVQQATTDKRLLQIEQADKASQAFWAWIWLIFMLCVLEGARSLALWALITDISAKDAQRDRERSDELAELRHQNEMAALLAQRVQAAPAPMPEPIVAPPVVIEPIAATTPAPEPESAPAATPDSPEPIVEELILVEPEPLPEPDLTPAQQRGRAGGLAAGQAKAAARAKSERLIPVGDWEARDAIKQAAE